MGAVNLKLDSELSQEKERKKKKQEMKTRVEEKGHTHGQWNGKGKHGLRFPPQHNQLPSALTQPWNTMKEYTTAVRLSPVEGLDEGHPLFL